MFVTPLRNREYRHLIGVFQRIIAARHIAIDRCITDAHLAFIAGGHQHVAEFVGQRHKCDAAYPALYILFGNIDIHIRKAA